MGDVVSEPPEATACLLGGFLAPLAESVAVGVGLRAPGWVRNIGTTLTGALLAHGVWRWVG
jgi:hypothetical protein